MTRATKRLSKIRRKARQHGSALLVSLMVMVGLSLLGLAFVSISETENAISVNEKNHTQTVAIAEAGAKLVVQWFQSPATMRAQNLMPLNESCYKTSRTVDTSTGYYKPSGNICDTPYGPNFGDLLYGNESHADIVINATTLATSSVAGTQTFLSDLNAILFPSTENGEITEIKIFAPPIVGATLVNGFYVGGQRFGIATVAVTAQKKVNNAVAAQAVVRLVVGPFPTPGPTGAIQAIGAIGNNGNFNVHWGTVESEQPIDLTKSGLDKISIPWFDAWDISHIERGYDSSSVWKPSTAYNAGHIVTATTTAITGTPALSLHAYVATTAGTTSATEPTWPIGTSATVADGGVTWKERPTTMWPLKTVDPSNYDNHFWLNELVGRTIADPWFAMRSWLTVAGGTATGGSTVSPHPYPYAAATPPTTWGGSNWFQYQTFSARPNYKVVEIPKFDYNFWKSAAIAAKGQPGVKYLTYVGGNYTDGVVTQSANSWLSGGNGFYFFETTNAQNPQNGGSGILDPSDFSPCGFNGFVYGNFSAIKTTGTGCQGFSGLYPEPGEPYRDIGYRQVVETPAGSQTRGNWATDAAGAYVVKGAYNGKWDYQDLDWSDTGSDSTGNGTKNNYFDVFVAQRTVKRESDGTNVTAWFPVEYYPGCKPGNNYQCPTCNCSEPHEPYVNIQYSTANTNIVVGWYDPTLAGRGKLTDSGLPTGNLVTCTAADIASVSGQSNCTSNAYDYNGGMVTLPVAVKGVIFNQGSLTSTGNADYFGSIVLGQAADPKGTPDVWYDERLVKGGWPPAGVNFPRVLVTSEEIQ